MTDYVEVKKFVHLNFLLNISKTVFLASDFVSLLVNMTNIL